MPDHQNIHRIHPGVPEPGHKPGSLPSEPEHNMVDIWSAPTLTNLKEHMGGGVGTIALIQTLANAIVHLLLAYSLIMDCREDWDIMFCPIEDD